MKSKIFFFDIDGTLVDSSHQKPYLTPTTYDALRKLKADGHQIIFSTGRCLGYLHEQLLSLKPDGMILANGAYIIYHDKVLSHYEIARNEVMTLIEYCEAHQIEYVIEGKEKYVCKQAFKHMMDFFKDFAIPLTKRLEDLPDDFMTCKIAVIPPSQEASLMIYDEFHTHYQMMRHIDGSYDIYPFTISKGKALTQILEVSHYIVEDSIAFGDGYNDLDLLENVGLGIAMGNANDSVKAKAKDVCLSVASEGVAKKLHDLGYI